jgi:uncharacterized protein YdeI (BOF family)
MIRKRILKHLFVFTLLLVSGTILMAQPGGPGGRPSGPPPGGFPGGHGGPRGNRPNANQTQTIRQKKVVKDSSLLTVTGTLVDSVSGEALIFVNVGVMSMKDSSMVRGTVTDDKGRFEAKNIHPGKYFLQISSIGYETRRVPIVVSNNTAMGLLKMKPGATTLDAVEITAKRPLFAMEGEKMIYNVAEDPSVQDGTTSDALQNAPGVEVDIQGNVTLRGVSSVEIWINDRPSKLTSENLKTYLETLPANALDHIEVISNPSAKYATNSDAVINIITTAHIKSNHFISFGLSGSSTPTLRPWLSYMWANEKLSFNIFASGSRNRNESENSSFSAYSPWNKDSSAYILAERDTSIGNSNSKRWNGNVFLNFDYQIDSTSDLSGWGSFNGSSSKGNSYSSITRDQTFSGDNLYHYCDTTTTDGGNYFGVLGLNYEKKFNDKGHNLRVNADGDINGSNNKDYYIRDYNTTYSFNNYNKYYKSHSGDNGIGLSARYNLPLDTNTDLSIGVGADHNEDNGTYDRLLLDSATQAYSIVDTLRSYTFNLVTNSANMDLNLTRRWGSFTAELGMGADVNDIDLNYTNKYFPATDQRFNDDTTLKLITYTPSLHLSYYTKDMNNFNLSYTLRMSNPDARQLSTFRSYSEDSYSTGNRDLKPELRHQLEAGWSKYFTQFGFVGVDAYMNYSADEISSLSDATTEADEFLERVINYSMPYNMGYSYRYGLQLHSTFRPSGFMNVRFNANIYNYGYHMDRGEQGILENNKWSYSLRMNAWYKFKTNYQIFGSASYRSPTIGLASVSKANYDLDFGVRGDFFKRKLSAFIMVQDIFNWGYKYGSGSENTNPAYTGTSTSKSLTSRYITGGITLRFGKMELETKAKEDDSTGSATGTGSL